MYFNYRWVGIATVLSTLWLPGFAKAKDPLDNRPTGWAGYALSLEGDQIRDDLLVPMRFEGVGGSPAIAFGMLSDRASLETKVGIAASYVMERDGNPGVVLTSFLEIEGYRKRFNAWGRLSLDVGALWRSRISNAMLASWDDAHLYFLASHVFGPAAALILSEVGRTEVSFILRLPFLGAAGRPLEERFVKQESINAESLFVAPHRHLHLALPPVYRAVVLSLRLVWRTKRSRISLSYDFDYERDDEPLTFRRLIHRLSFVQEFQLGGRR